MTPWEFGSWAFGSTRKVRGAFTPIEYVGSELDNAQPSGKCYKGFDQMSYVASLLFSASYNGLVPLERHASHRRELYTLDSTDQELICPALSWALHPPFSAELCLL